VRRKPHAPFWSSGRRSDPPTDCNYPQALLVPFAKAQYILDHPHLKSHFYETAEALGMEAAERTDWVSGHLKQLWNGKVKGVLKMLRQRYEAEPHERLRRLIEFVERLKDCLHYGAYKARGWPIGSGEVESAHCYVPQERLKIPGACWHPDNVNPMLSRVSMAGWTSRRDA
jgi:hypothetical protein